MQHPAQQERTVNIWNFFFLKKELEKNYQPEPLSEKTRAGGEHNGEYKTPRSRYLEDSLYFCMQKFVAEIAFTVHVTRYVSCVCDQRDIWIFVFVLILGIDPISVFTPTPGREKCILPATFLNVWLLFPIYKTRLQEHSFFCMSVLIFS